MCDRSIDRGEDEAYDGDGNAEVDDVRAGAVCSRSRDRDIANDSLNEYQLF